MQIDLVAGLSRPGGNVTGVTLLGVEIGPKLLELLHEVVPKATNLALLVNPINPNSETESRNLQAAARKLGLQLASGDRDSFRQAGVYTGRILKGEKPADLAVVQTRNLS